MPVPALKTPMYYSRAQLSQCTASCVVHTAHMLSVVQKAERRRVRPTRWVAVGVKVARDLAKCGMRTLIAMTVTPCRTLTCQLAQGEIKVSSHPAARGPSIRERERRTTDHLLVLPVANVHPDTERLSLRATCQPPRRTIQHTIQIDQDGWACKCTDRCDIRWIGRTRWIRSRSSCRVPL